jgi:hypothetical protein
MNPALFVPPGASKFLQGRKAQRPSAGYPIGRQLATP